MRNYVYTPDDLLRILLQKEGITEGHWELGIDMQGKGMSISERTGQIASPGLMLRLQGLRLIERAEPTPATIDAAKLVRR